MNEQQLAAVKQALEAFSVLSMNDYSGYECSKHETDKIDAAITALQSIISQDALDKMAEDARTIGLRLDDWDKIGCVNHDCYRCKAVQEPVGDWVWSWLMDWCKRNGIAPATQDSLFAMVKDARGKFESTPPAQPAPNCTRSHPHENMDAMCELRTEIARLTNENARLKAQPAVQPVAWRWVNSKGWVTYGELPHDTFKSTPLYTTPPAAQPAVQEPVAQCTNSDIWNCKYCRKTETCEALEDPRNFATLPAPQPVPVKTYHDGKPWPVAPKPWVGLTDYEIGVCSTEAAMNRSEMVGGAVTFARAIEAKLKEKNHG